MSFTVGLEKHQPWTPLHTTINTSSNPLSTTSALKISEDDMRQVFRENKRRKAPGPDGVTSVCLKSCADQQAPIFRQIFNRSLELCEVPSCFKRSTITPVPKKPQMTGLNDYRHVFLTSVVMKSFERRFIPQNCETNKIQNVYVLFHGGNKIPHLVVLHKNTMIIKTQI